MLLNRLEARPARTSEEFFCHLACADGSLPGAPESDESVAALYAALDAHGDVNEKGATGSTLLLWAAARDRARIVGVLLSRGADPFYQNRLSETAAHYAAKHGSVSVLKLLPLATLSKKRPGSTARQP